MDEQADTPLTEEDNASVLTAMRALADRYRSGWTLNEALARWRLVVTDIEEGFDTEGVWEYHNELACRDWLCEAWPLLTDRVRALRQPSLNAMDDRFTAATAPMQGKKAEGRRNGRWWHDRYPRRVVGQPDDELPPPWSPAPEYIEDD
ncbi:hypothetical protein [Streptomyces sp. NBC_00306]|uniref:hypothetical protein n=1 Tax=Streptomyces sp. NBC_00306 TaxID=2975708 RepID=UPI002E286066|nr:hypothetical protein [Streptomyces sp. NBC_00306]